MNKHTYAISACLMGENCKYNGKNNYKEELVQYMQNQKYICVCPEVFGGLPTPRSSCERVNDLVMNKDGQNVTNAFRIGARIALEKMKEAHVDVVISQSRSPSCGKGVIYDGSFQGILKEGNGVFVDACVQEGYQVYDIQEFLEIIGKEMK